MSHNTAREAFRKLSERINRFPQGAPPTDLLFQILAVLFTPAEAELVALLPLKPFTALRGTYDEDDQCVSCRARQQLLRKLAAIRRMSPPIGLISTLPSMPQPDRASTPTRSDVVTFLFTDIEGSTALWEQGAERMGQAMARHDALTRAAVETQRGVVVKTTGDGVHAAFDDPLDALAATLKLQQALANPEATHGIMLAVRCGVHAGVVERRDHDFFGTAVNRAARIMSAAHGGQVLVSQAVATLVNDRLIPGGFTLRDLGVARLRDLTSVEHVFQLLHPQLRADFPALRTLEATPNNLPLQLTSFVGRKRELTEVEKLLGTTRLLTLVGVGGIGKTRLSLQLGASVMEQYTDGVWLVELAALADSRDVPLAVASVLGVTEEAGHPLAEALFRFVKDRKLLLILDNCEHLLYACAELAKHLLQAGPDVRVLASSREPLHVFGETSYPVPPLAVPKSDATIALADLEQFEAANLFIDRARSAYPAKAIFGSPSAVVFLSVDAFTASFAYQTRAQFRSVQSFRPTA